MWVVIFGYGEGVYVCVKAGKVLRAADLGAVDVIRREVDEVDGCLVLLRVRVALSRALSERVVWDVGYVELWWDVGVDVIFVDVSIVVVVDVIVVDLGGEFVGWCVVFIVCGVDYCVCFVSVEVV